MIFILNCNIIIKFAREGKMIQFHPPFHLEPSGAPPSLMVFGLRQTNFGNLFLGVGPSFWKASVVGGGEIAGKLVRMQWGMLPRLRNCSTQYTVGWSDFHFFWNFWKRAHCYRLAIFVWVQFKKFSEFCRVRTRRKIFIFKKSQGPWKLIFFF